MAAKELVALAEPNSHQLDFSRGNNKARARMSAQYYVASLLNGLVIGTDHGAEAITGFLQNTEMVRVILRHYSGSISVR